MPYVHKLVLLIICSTISFSVTAAYNFQVVTAESFDTVSNDVIWTNDTSQTDYPSDDDYQLVNIGFTFYLGNTAYTQTRIISNGALHFGPDQGFHKDFSNEQLAITNFTNGPGFEEAADRVVLAYWDDLEPSQGGSVKYETLGIAPNRRFVTSFENVPRYNNNSTSYTFQIVLFENGQIRFKYGNDDANGASATIGIEVDDLDFTEYSFNSNSVSDTSDILWTREFPAITSVTASCTELNTVQIIFNEAVFPVRATDITNFSINNGVTISAASLISSNIVELTTSTLSTGITYTLTSTTPTQSANFSLNTLVTETFLDQFNSSSYSNNNGSSVWTSNWVEIADDGTPTGGNVHISGGELLFDDRPNSAGEPSIYREADLTGYTAATLTFDYNTPGNLENSDRFDILISSNGGASYIVINTFSNDVNGSASYDISTYISNNTRIRFTVENNYGGNNEQMEIDNVTITASRLTPCTSPLDHIEITHDGTALTCSPETLTIKACADINCTTVASDDIDVTLSTIGGLSTWSQNPFTIPANSNTGISIDLTHRTPETITLSSSSTPTADNPLICSPLGCELTFSDSGFILTLANHNSCTVPNLQIQAVKLSDTGNSCAPAYSGNQSVNFVYNYLNPTSGIVVPRINSDSTSLTDLAANQSTVQNRIVNFDATATATLPFQYNDAGQISLTVSDAGANGLASSSVISIVTPPQLTVVASEALSDCISGDANCSAFKKAGESFNLLINAVCSNGNTTPNFEHNNVTLTVATEAPLVIAPAIQPTVSLGISTIDFIDSNNGLYNLSNQTISEVGVFTITASANNYLNSGLNVTGTSSNIGRFTPDHFALLPNLILEQCNTFTYGGYFDSLNSGLNKNGQLFSISGNITAENLSGVTTKNYVASFAKLQQADITAQAFNISNNANDTGRINFSPATLNFLNGASNFNDSTSHFQYESLRNALNLRVDLTATDSDSVTSSIVSSNEFDIRNGRLVLAGTFGPETNDLEMKIFSEYYDGLIWAINSQDSCSTYINTDASFSSATYTEQLNPGDTLIFAPVNAQTLSFGLSTINNGLWFEGSGAGNYGSVIINYDLTNQSWLKFDWDNDLSIDNPTGLLSFGYYRGSDRIIYWKEVRN